MFKFRRADYLGTLMIYKMHSWILNDDSYYYSVCKHLQNNVPEFKSTWDKDDIYLMMFEFGGFIVENINNDEISRKCFNFLNEAIEKGGSKTEDAIVLEIFHQLYDGPTYIQKARASLSTKGLAIFDKAYNECKT